MRKSLIDLTAVPELMSFPWVSVCEGLARSNKTVTTYFGDEHSKQHETNDGRWSDRSTWRWYNAFSKGLNVEGFNVSLTSFIGEHWWARMHEPDIWKPTANYLHFTKLMQWLKVSQIFKHTGRIVFFIHLGGQTSPLHTDFDPLLVPEHLRQPSDFLWLTPPNNPKQLTVGHETAPWACWFNHFVLHGSAPVENRTQWSLRIDGQFDPQFAATYIERQA